MDDDRIQRGLENRRRVLGDEYVENSMSKADSFNRPLQNLISEYCWGEVWSGTAIDFKTRSLLNIGMLAALGREQELHLHVGGAYRNGCSPAEIAEVIMQVAIYAGVPAASSASKIARAALTELDVDLS